MKRRPKVPSDVLTPRQLSGPSAITTRHGERDNPEIESLRTFNRLAHELRNSNNAGAFFEGRYDLMRFAGVPDSSPLPASSRST